MPVKKLVIKMQHRGSVPPAQGVCPPVRSSGVCPPVRSSFARWLINNNNDALKYETGFDFQPVYLDYQHVKEIR